MALSYGISTQGMTQYDPMDMDQRALSLMRVMVCGVDRIRWIPCDDIVEPIRLNRFEIGLEPDSDFG